MKALKYFSTKLSKSRILRFFFSHNFHGNWYNGNCFHPCNSIFDEDAYEAPILDVQGSLTNLFDSRHAMISEGSMYAYPKINQKIALICGHVRLIS